MKQHYVPQFYYKNFEEMFLGQVRYSGLNTNLLSKSPPTMLCKCPYLISFSTKYTVAISGFYACKGLFCVRQMSPIVLHNPPYESHITTAIDSIYVPWQVGDNVDIRLKVDPVHNDGTGFSDWQASMIDLGPSQVIAP